MMHYEDVQENQAQQTTDSNSMAFGTNLQHTHINH